MKWLKRIGLLVLALVVLLALVGVFLPSKAHVERGTEIAAAPATVFAVLDNYHLFNKWSPWAALDPKTQYRFSGPPVGKGAMMSWASDDPRVGHGNMQLIQSDPDRLVTNTLQFGNMNPALGTFLLTPIKGGGTHVVWSFDTRFGWDLLGRYAGLFLDRLIGPDYEVGLKNLKAYAEALPKTDFSGLEITDVPPIAILYLSGRSTTDSKSITKMMAGDYARLYAFAQKNNLYVAGSPIAVTRRWDYQDKVYEFDAALPVTPGAIPAGSDVKLGQLGGGKAVHALYLGAYTGIGAVYDRINAFMQVSGLQPAGFAWEQYANDVRTTPPDKLVTHIYMPVK